MLTKCVTSGMKFANALYGSNRHSMTLSPGLPMCHDVIILLPAYPIWCACRNVCSVGACSGRLVGLPACYLAGPPGCWQPVSVSARNAIQRDGMTYKRARCRVIGFRARNDACCSSRFLTASMRTRVYSMRYIGSLAVCQQHRRRQYKLCTVEVNSRTVFVRCSRG